MSNNERPTRCIDPVIKYCQNCQYGHTVYDDEEAVRAFPDEDHFFTTYCTLGLQDTKPTPEELAEADAWFNDYKEVENEPRRLEDNRLPF